MGRTSVATDNFNRAGPALGANWSNINNAAAGDITITASTHVEGGSFGNGAVAIWVGTGSFTADQYSSVVLSTGDTGSINYGGGVVARASGSDSTLNCYFVRKSNTCEFGKVTNGTTSQFAGFPQALALTGGDRLEIECEGTTIRVMKNGVAIGGQFTVTDSTHSSGTPGLMMVGDAAGLINGDDWEGGNYSGLVNVSPSPTGISSTGSAGEAYGFATPPPPYTLMRVTG